MAFVRIYDAAGRGANITGGSTPFGAVGEVSFVSRTFLGGSFGINYYLEEYSVSGSSTYDAFLVEYYVTSGGTEYLQSVEYYDGDRLIFWIDDIANTTVLSLNRDGLEGILRFSDNMIGNSFDDQIRGYLGDDRIEGLGGNDTLFGGVGNDTIFGNDGNDTLIGQENNDVLYGGAGDDSIDGNSENDLLVGEDGNDTLNGQEGFDELQGGFGNDILNGGSEDDLLFGEDGNDTLNGAEGNDTLIGGSGLDSVAFFGSQDEYILQLYDGFAQITDRFLQGDGTDDLVSIEQLSFLDTDFDLSQFDGITNLSAQEFETFIELYIAYFNRAPDSVGLNFWGTAFANGVTLEEIATYFIDQDETRATYPDGTSNTDFVTTVYDNVLGRIPDQGGFDFWVGVLNSGGVSRDQFILEVLRGVPDGSSDRAYLNTKVDIGVYFAVHLGMSDVDNASAAMAIFDGSQGSVNQAVVAIDNYYDQALDPDTGEFLMQVIGVLDNPFAV